MTLTSENRLPVIRSFTDQLMGWLSLLMLTQYISVLRRQYLCSGVSNRHKAKLTTLYDML